MGADDVAGGEHAVEVVGADDAPDQQHAGEQAEAAEGGDDERHARAIACASALWCQKPMRRNEKMLVISQKTTSMIRLPESTIPPIAPMKARSSAKKRGAGSLGER